MGASGAGGDGVDITVQARAVLALVEGRKMLTLNKIVEEWKKGGRGAGTTEGGAGALKKIECERVVVHLILQGILKQKFKANPYGTTAYVVPGPRAAAVLAGKERVHASLDFDPTR